VGLVAFIWDLEDDPEGNYWHICVEGHGVTREVVEEVMAENYETATRSRSSGQHAAAVGRRLVLTTEAIRDTRPAQGKAKRVRVARER
jgi:hypothetical protein